MKWEGDYDSYQKTRKFRDDKQTDTSRQTKSQPKLIVECQSLVNIWLSKRQSKFLNYLKSALIVILNSDMIIILKIYILRN